MAEDDAGKVMVALLGSRSSKIWGFKSYKNTATRRRFGGGTQKQSFDRACSRFEPCPPFFVPKCCRAAASTSSSFLGSPFFERLPEECYKLKFISSLWAWIWLTEVWEGRGIWWTTEDGCGGGVKRIMMMMRLVPLALGSTHNGVLTNILRGPIAKILWSS